MVNYHISSVIIFLDNKFRSRNTLGTVPKLGLNGFSISDALFYNFYNSRLFYNFL